MAVLGIVLLIYSKNKLKFLIGSLIMPLHYGLMLLVPNFVENVFLYHITKQRMFTGWTLFLRSNLHIIILFLLSIKFIKDKKFIYLASSYILFILIFAKSTFEYYFFILIALLCIEGSLIIDNFRYKKVFWVLAILMVAMMSFRYSYFIFYSSGYNKISDYVSTLDGDIMGQSDLANMVALKTGKNILGLQIDTNYQRRNNYNYSNAVVVHYRGLFDGNKYNCKLLNTIQVNIKEFDIWKC